jgi:hypothetical protein
MPVDNSANIQPLVSRERIGNSIRDALRLFIGRGRRYSVKQVSNATGVKDRVIECAMTPVDSVDYRPLSLEALVSITGFLGADFTNEWLDLAGQGAFDLPDESEPPPGMLAADVAGDSAEIARRAADGEFDADDRKHLRAVGQRKIERGMQLVAMAKAA